MVSHLSSEGVLLITTPKISLLFLCFIRDSRCTLGCGDEEDSLGGEMGNHLVCSRLLGEGVAFGCSSSAHKHCHPPSSPRAFLPRGGVLIARTPSAPPACTQRR